MGRRSDGLTAVWFGVALLAGVAVGWRRRSLLLPLALGYATVAVVVAVMAALIMFTDREVNERVVTGAPAAQAGAGEAPAAGNVRLAAGSFVGVAHFGRGNAAVVELPGGERKLTLTDFRTSNGPDLRVRLATGNPATGELGDTGDLGALKGNIGDQQYDVPAGLDLDRYATVVVWCRAFSVAFTSAGLSAS